MTAPVETYALRSTPEPVSPVLLPPIVKLERLLSLDALRGFDMFWILGGEGMINVFAKWVGNPAFEDAVRRNTEHPDWNGFSFYDLIFPLFMFIAGVSVPLSLMAAAPAG